MENPYSSPESAAPPEIVPKPSQITVFGILHILAAVAGFGTLLFSMASSKSPNATFLEAFQQEKDSQVSFTPEALEGLDKALSLNIYFEVFTAVLATMLLTSGLAMLLNARWGISLSNKYAFLSIGLKIISLVLVALVVAPGYQAFCDGITGADTTFVNTICITMKITSFVSPLATMIYPILALILLNRPSVKKYQASL